MNSKLKISSVVCICIVAVVIFSLLNVDKFRIFNSEGVLKTEDVVSAVTTETESVPTVSETDIESVKTGTSDVEPVETPIISTNATEVTTTDEFGTYSNSEFGFSLKYPKDWVVVAWTNPQKGGDEHVLFNLSLKSPDFLYDPEAKYGMGGGAIVKGSRVELAIYSIPNFVGYATVGSILDDTYDENPDFKPGYGGYSDQKALWSGEMKGVEYFFVYDGQTIISQFDKGNIGYKVSMDMFIETEKYNAGVLPEKDLKVYRDIVSSLKLF